jgi:hypothetical protein
LKSTVTKIGEALTDEPRQQLCAVGRWLTTLDGDEADAWRSAFGGDRAAPRLLEAIIRVYRADDPNFEQPFSDVTLRKHLQKYCRCGGSL